MNIGYENCKFYAVSLVQYIHAYIFLLNICRSQLSLAIEVQLSKFVKNFENSILRRFLKPLPKHRSIFSENSKFLDVTVNVFSKKSITSLFVILEFLYSSFDPCEHIFLVSWKELLNVISNEKKNLRDRINGDTDNSCVLMKILNWLEINGWLKYRVHWLDMTC